MFDRTVPRLPWCGQQKAKEAEEEDSNFCLEFAIVTKVCLERGVIGH